VTGRRGPDGVRLQPPDRRDGADRRAPDRHRGRPAAGRHHGGRTFRRERLSRRRVPRPHLRQRRVPRREQSMTAQPMTAHPMTPHYRFRHVARMEWIKLRTLRSVRWTLLFALAGMIGIGIAAGYNTRNPRGDVTNNILVGGALGSVLFAVLGVLVMTSEYSSGTIRATLAAIPRRPLVLAAKAAVFGAVTLLVGEAASFISFFAVAATLRHGIAAPTLGQPGVLRAVAVTGTGFC